MKRGALLLMVAVMAACAGGSGRPGFSLRRDSKRGTFEGIELVELETRPSAPPVDRYASDVDHTLSPTEQAMAERIAAAGTVKASPALSRMARELAATAPDQYDIPPALVDELMAWSGLVDPPPRVVVAEMARDPHGCAEQPAPACREPIEALAAQVRASLPKGSHVMFGVGVARLEGGATRLLAAVLDRTVALKPMPTALDEGQTMTLAGRLLGARSQPRIEMIDPDGNWSPVPTMVEHDGSFSARIRCQPPLGTYQVEVLAEGRHGPEVTANFPFRCGRELPDRLRVELERLAEDVTPEQIARANFVYLNAEREQRGLPRLKWSEAAAEVATAHSRDMRRGGFVGHRSPKTGDVIDRFRRAEIKGTVIRENVARGYGPKGIHESLMRSPGHRINIVAADVTHVGIGIVIGAAETAAEGAPRPVYATQNFFRAPGAGAPTGDLTEALRGQVDERREAAGLPPVQWDEVLSGEALRHAEAIAAGRKPKVEATLERRVTELGHHAVDRHQVETDDYQGLVRLALWQQRGLGPIGVGIARVGGREGSFVLIAFEAVE